MKSLHSAFLRRAVIHPGRPALSHRETTWTYSELLRRTLSIAASLPSLPTESRLDVVAIVGEKTPDSVAAVLGALCAGYAYCTLPTDSPRAQFDTMLRLLQPKVLVTTSLSRQLCDVLVHVDYSPKAIVDLAGDLPSAAFPDVPRFNCGAPAAARRSGHLAYVLFTSGSTGPPKGVCMSHESATTAVAMFLGHHPLREGDRVANQVALCFDLSIFDIFATLTAGAHLRLLDPVESEPDRLIAGLDRHGISSLFTVPTVLDAACCSEGARFPSTLRQVLLSGEPLKTAFLERVFDCLPHETALWNLFGGTEMPYVLARKVDRRLFRLANTFDIVGRHVETRVEPFYGKDGEGELVVSGAVLTGYLETAEAPSTRSLTEYRSGDIVRIERDGGITALGRADRQVKIDGVRVELDAVERVLEAHPNVREAGAIASIDGLETIAFIVTRNRGGGDFEIELDAHCREQLRPIECPTRYLLLESLPKTSSGKKDRVKLRSALIGCTRDEIANLG